MRKIVVRIAVAATLLLCAGSAFAAPAKRTNIAVVQSDGTELIVSQRGDEHFHYFVTDDGMPLIQAESGDFYHAIIRGGSLIASDIMAHAGSQRTERERAFIAKRGDISNDINDIRRATVQRRNAERTNSMRKTRAGKTVKYEGNKRGLVILVNFKDNAFTIPSPKEHYERMLNEKGYSENGCHNCVSQYFSDQSNGVFNLTFDVAGPYTLTNNIDYYGGNISNGGDDKNPRAMIREACKQASADVDYSKYDWFGDGNVDMVFVVYAGYGESQGGAPETVWPHQWELGFQSLSYNGKKINVYACSSELADGKGNIPDGIGTFCHEFSHCLGLPDFYDTQGSSFGMSEWSLMDYGTYLGKHTRGECPCNYTTYERWACGWATPTELTVPVTVQGMASLDSGNTGYIIYNDAHADEYYVLDNRQKHGWDSYLPGHGLLVTHVDYNERRWYNNTVNTDISHQRCTIIHADNSTNNLAGDTYPGTTGNTELTDTSTPAAHLFNDNSSGKKYMGKPVTGIAESEDGLISFKFMEGTESAVNGITANGESPAEIRADYRQLLPRGIRLERSGNKTIKIIDKK